MKRNEISLQPELETQTDPRKGKEQQPKEAAPTSVTGDKPSDRKLKRNAALEGPPLPAGIEQDDFFAS